MIDVELLPDIIVMRSPSSDEDVDVGGVSQFEILPSPPIINEEEEILQSPPSRTPPIVGAADRSLPYDPPDVIVMGSPSSDQDVDVGGVSQLPCTPINDRSLPYDREIMDSQDLLVARPRGERGNLDKDYIRYLDSCSDSPSPVRTSDGEFSC